MRNAHNIIIKMSASYLCVCVSIDSCDTLVSISINLFMLFFETEDKIYLLSFVCYLSKNNARKEYTSNLTTWTIRRSSV